MLTEMQETDGLNEGMVSMRARMAALRKKFQQDLPTGGTPGEGGRERGGEPMVKATSAAEKQAGKGEVVGEAAEGIGPGESPNSSPPRI